MYDDVVSGLSSKYQEAAEAGGLTLTGNLVQVLTAPEGATWTIIVTMPNGFSCFVAFGEDWTYRRPL